MSLYVVADPDINTSEASALTARLRAWHDAMVAHERRRRVRPDDEDCDDECPHAEARELWSLARQVLGDRAGELAFLRAKAEDGGVAR